MSGSGLEAPPLAVSEDIVATIGDTPLIDVSGLSPNPDVRILAKMESHNPTGSIKDRTAKSLIDDAEARGIIRPGDTITYRRTITEARPSASRPGIGLVKSQWEAVNQRGQTVMTMEGWAMFRRRPAG